MDETTRKQVAAQCRAVAHMADALALVHKDKAQMIGAGSYGPTELVGRHTARLMETLGDILNGMDAVDETEDAWLDPVFKEAQRRWPSTSGAF
jgi:hypothetical protein